MKGVRRRFQGGNSICKAQGTESVARKSRKDKQCGWNEKEEEEGYHEMNLKDSSVLDIGHSRSSGGHQRGLCEWPSLGF